MQLARFRNKALRQLHEDGSAKGLPSSMVDKLSKLLFALETADDLEQVGRFPGWKLLLPQGFRFSWLRGRFFCDRDQFVA